MVTANENDDGGDTEQTPARRSVLRSIGAAGATVSAGTAATGSVTASDDGIGTLARANATEQRARDAFRSELGRDLLELLDEEGYVESATFDALNVSSVSATPTLNREQVTVTEGRHPEEGAIVGFTTALRTDEFDGPLIVRLFPEAGIAGATAERDGEPVVVSPEYGGLVPQSEAQPQSCDSCVGWIPDVCEPNDCDCSRPCTNDSVDMDSEYRAHHQCSDGTGICNQCWLCCDVDCGW